MSTYVRESHDLVPLSVKSLKNGSTTTVTSYMTALVPDGSRPTVWTPSVTVDGDTGLVLPGTATTKGRWRIFVKIADNDLSPVIDVGVIALV